MHVDSRQVFGNKYEINPETLLSALKPLFRSGVEYLGLINKQGRLVEAAYKKELVVPASQLEMFFMGLRLQCSMQEEFDESLGHLSHVVVQRENLKILAVPVFSLIVTAVTKSNANNRKIIEKIVAAVHNLQTQNDIQDNATGSISYLTT